MRSFRKPAITLLLILLSLSCGDAFAQNPNRIQEILVEGAKQASPALIIVQSGLQAGSSLSSDNTSEAVRKLWNLGIFSDVRILREEVENGSKVVIRVVELPVVNSILLDGFREFKEQEVINTINLARNKAIGERTVAKMTRQILDMYIAKGFLLADVNFRMNPLPDDSSKVDVAITVTEGKKVKVKKITFEGNQNIGAGKLKKIMQTKEDRWFSSGDFKKENLEKDKDTIVRYYKTQGYRDASVLSDTLLVNPKNDDITLQVRVNEGQKYKFGKTTIDGNSVFPDEELLAFVSYQEGETFNEDLIITTFYQIMVHYNDSGYLNVAVDRIQTAHGDTVDVHYDIAEGNISKVAKVIVQGNTKTIDKVIRREIELFPGESFNRTKFEESARNLRMLNFFAQDETGVEPNYTFAENGKDVNLIYKVKEKQTGMASVGAGYSERDKLVGTLSFTNGNLFGRGQSLNFAWDMGTRRKALQLGFSEPWLFDTRTSFSFDLYDIQRSDYTSAFDQEQRRGGYVRVGRRLKWPDDSRLYLSYRLEDVDYTNPSSYYSYYLVTGKTSALSLMFTRDTRDQYEFATNGSRTSATVEIAGGPLGGDLSYYKYLLNNEFYTPLFWKFSLVARSRIGFLKGYKQDNWVPYSERFMPGGTSYDGFIRGYPNRQVGPLLRGEEVGGETMLVNNIELQLPIIKGMIYGIGFYDFGNAWRSLSQTNPFDVKRSAGVGVRMSIPQIGMIGFDVGYGFDKLEGMNRVGGWRTHFQFGNMF
ncbi:MAG: outer membrane protein assembly factor BamA [Candidatus Latescibacterota bacterium]